MTATDDEQAAFAPQLGQYREWLDGSAGLAASTVSSYSGHAAGHLRWLATQHPTTPLDETRRDHVEGYLASMAARGCAGATRRLALHALRSFYAWHQRDTAASLNPAAATRRPRSRPPATTIYSEAEATPS